MSRKLRPAPVRLDDGLELYRAMFATSEDDPGSTLPPGLPTMTVGWDVLAWVTANLVDPGTGDPWRFTREQVRFVLWWYAHDAAGRPLFTRGEIVRMKGHGKSPFAAVLALAETLGPCRPGPDGRAVPARSPYVPVAGVAEESTESTLEFVRRIAKTSALPIDVGIGRLVTADGGLIEGITASPWTAEGKRPTFTVGDESQHWTPTNRGRELYRVLLRNAAKAPDGWARVLTTTNRHEPGMDSVAETMWDAHQANLPGVLYDCREGPADVELNDRSDVMRAVQVAAGDSWWVPVERIADEAPLTNPAVFHRYYLNHLTHAVDSWLDASEYDACVDPDVIVDPADPIVLGFDGSIGRTGGGVADSTALVGCRVSDGHLFLIACWSQPPGGAAWTVPIDEVRLVVEATFARYNVVGFGADPAGWEGVVADWEAAYGARLGVKAGATPIAYRFNRTGIVVRDTAALHDAIVGREVTVDNTHTLRAHALNARRHATASGIQLRKEHPSSDRKIDAIVAAVIAYSVALTARRVGLDRPPAPTFVPRRIR